MTKPLTVRFVPIALALAAITLSACQSSVETVTAQAQQAQQLLDAGRIAEAEKLITDAVQERDDVPAVLLVQAHVAMARGNRGLAYQAYSNAMALEATNPEALLGVAQLGLGTGHIEQAADAADKILILQPEQVSALTIKALIAIVRSDLDTADGLADRILKREPGDLGGLILKSRVQALRGDRDAALATLKEGELRYALSPDLAMALAEVYRAKGDTANLLQQLNRIKQTAPTALNYRMDLVDVLYRTGQQDAARSEVASIIGTPVEDTETIDKIVRLWYANDPTALTPAGIQVATTKASLIARLTFARYFVATGRPAIALAILKPLATGWSADVSGLYAFAGDAAGQPAARAEAARLIKEDSTNGGALLVRIREAMAQGRPKAAVVDAQRVAADYPQWDEGHLALAAAYVALDDKVGVRRAFESGLKARPQSLPLTTAYVKRLPSMGDTLRAIEVARRFALNSPSLPAAWKFYTETCARLQGDDCKEEAAAGLAASATRYGLDPAPGTPAAIAAIARLD